MIVLSVTPTHYWQPILTWWEDKVRSSLTGVAHYTPHYSGPTITNRTRKPVTGFQCEADRSGWGHFSDLVAPRSASIFFYLADLCSDGFIWTEDSLETRLVHTDCWLLLHCQQTPLPVPCQLFARHWDQVWNLSSLTHTTQCYRSASPPTLVASYHGNLPYNISL